MRHRAAPLPVIVILLALCLALPAAGQEQRQRFLDPETPTTDDPRRIPVPEGWRAWEGSVVIRGARLWDGTGRPAREATVVVEGSRIAAVLDPGDDGWPPEAEILDVPGTTLLPGLVELHAHLTYTEPGLPIPVALSAADQALRGMERLRYFVESGITSLRDVASHGDVPFRLKEWVAEHRLPGPRIFAAGKLITGVGGHGADDLSIHSHLYGGIIEASGPDEWRAAVRENFKAGADVIKIASHFTVQEAAAAVEEAHALGMKITADAETFYVDRAIEAGIDMIEHPLPRTDAAIEAMAREGVAAVPTLIVYTYLIDGEGGFFFSPSRRFSFSKQDNLAMLGRLRDAGIRMGIGTDIGREWYRHLPHPYIRELEAFVEAGFSRSEALQAATRVGAELLDMDHLLGTVEPGKLADMLIVDGRPDEDLRHLQDVRFVVRDGEVVVREGRVSIPRHVPTPEPGQQP